MNVSTLHSRSFPRWGRQACGQRAAALSDLRFRQGPVRVEAAPRPLPRWSRAGPGARGGVGTGGRRAGGPSRPHSFEADSKSGSHTTPHSQAPSSPSGLGASDTGQRSSKLFHVYPGFPASYGFLREPRALRRCRQGERGLSQAWGSTGRAAGPRGAVGPGAAASVLTLHL